MNKTAAALAVLGVGVMVHLSKKISSEVRGLRNNNPGNIRATGTAWNGATGDDGSFVIFSSPEYGIRAMTRILKTYAGRGIVTIEDIIATWAPSNENDTDSYIESVANKTGLSEFQFISDSDYPDLIAAIIYHENGQNPYSAELIKRGIGMA